MGVIDNLKKLVYHDMDPDKYDEIVKSLAKNLTNLKIIKQSTLSKLIGNLNKATVRQFTSSITVGQIESDRLSRYRTIEKVYQLIPELYQANKIYVDNILSPDVITKQTLVITTIDDQIGLSSSEVLAASRSLIKAIVKHTKLDEKSEDIVQNTCTYGDCFVEIIDGNEVPKQWKILQESQLKYDVQSLIIEFDTRKSKQFASYADCVITEALVKPQEQENASLSRISIKIHNPKHVVAFYIGDEPVGYLVIKPYGHSFNQTVNLQRQFIDKFIDLLTSNMKQLKNILDEHPGYKDDIAKVLAIIQTEKAQIRFVPADKMVHFKIPSPVYHPYGESIFTPVLDIAKYIIAMERALLIYRLTRAPEKRVFKVNVSRDRAEIPQILQEVIRETKQKEVAVSQAGDIDALMTEITMFDDFYIPVVEGTPSFEIETLPGGELQSKIEDVNYFKDKLIAGLGIPPIYLRPQDQQADNKSTLAQENARFARTIIRLQKIISNGLTELVNKIVEIVEPDKLVYTQLFRITFLPPTALMAEREQEIVNAVGNLIETLSKHGVPTELILKKYLPQYDWEAIKQESIISAKVDQLESGQSEEEME